MKFWQFANESYPDAARAGAWREALDSLGLQLEATASDAGFIGEMARLESPQGFEFSRVVTPPAELRVRAVNGRAVWLLLVIDGKASIVHDGVDTPVRPGEIAMGPTGVAGRLVLRSNARLLWVNVPAASFNPRLLGGSSHKIGHLNGRSGMGHMLAGLLRLVSDSINELGAAQIRPVESALSEFLLASLAENVANPPPPTGGNSATSVFLGRVYQSIEVRLQDPDLSLADIAKEQGISARYLQKLFESARDTFGNYVRRRRLERAAQDLSNPLLDRFSISQICFRWGFNDAAHFSRAFRDHYGVSPREYRTNARTGVPSTDHAPANRGRPGGDAQTRDGRDGRGEAGAARPANVVLARPGISRALPPRLGATHYHLPATDKTVHWGYLSQRLPSVLEIRSGDIVTIDTLTQHASDDKARMIDGDADAESVFLWTQDRKNVDRRGAGPTDASIFGRGSGEGFGVHICTGPIAVQDARPGDLLEVRIRDVRLRPSASREFGGRTFGSNAAAWWGYHYDDLLTQPKPREVVTIYEIHCGPGCYHASALYNYRWTPQTDPWGVVHNTIDYPGVPVDHASIEKNHDVLKGVRIPLRPHFGFIGVAPREATYVDSIPPGAFGGNLDDWRLGKGARIFLPVAVPGALFSVGDPHASQGDAELCGTAIECSLTGEFEFVLHKKADLDCHLRDITHPLIETESEWVMHGFSQPNYLAALGQQAQSEIYKRSSLDDAMRDAFRKARRFLMNAKGLSEDEAISLLSVGVDFGVTQVVNGNWGVHAVIRKELFGDEAD